MTPSRTDGDGPRTTSRGGKTAGNCRQVRTTPEVRWRLSALGLEGGVRHTPPSCFRDLLCCSESVAPSSSSSLPGPWHGLINGSWARTEPQPSSGSSAREVAPAVLTPPARRRPGDFTGLFAATGANGSAVLLKQRPVLVPLDDAHNVLLSAASGARSAHSRHALFQRDPQG